MERVNLELVRYADDFVVLCQREEQARQALETIEAFVQAKGLRLHPQKTAIVDMREPGGFDFLGYHFEAARWPRQKSMEKLKEALRAKPGAPVAVSRRSVQISVRCCEAGLSTSSTVRAVCLPALTAIPAVGCAAFCASEAAAGAVARVPIISAGPVPSSPPTAYSP
jgi:Reverse transcriptase (RNA-dependent DNA polymerase)